MYSVEFSETAAKLLYKLNKGMQKRIISVLERIKARPFHFVKRKQGTPYFILRAGDYRVILDIVKEEFAIFVVELGHRKDIYE